MFNKRTWWCGLGGRILLAVKTDHFLISLLNFILTKSCCKRPHTPSHPLNIEANSDMLLSVFNAGWCSVFDFVMHMQTKKSNIDSMQLIGSLQKAKLRDLGILPQNSHLGFTAAHSLHLHQHSWLTHL